jgi:hypothetical protein
VTNITLDSSYLKHPKACAYTAQAELGGSKTLQPSRPPDLRAAAVSSDIWQTRTQLQLVRPTAMFEALCFAIVVALAGPTRASSFTDPGPSLASAFSLSTSTSLPFPSATLDASGADSFLASSWGLNRGRVQEGADRLAFVADPFASSSNTSNTPAPTSPVLRVTYPAGSFSNDTGGSQFYAQWNASGDPFLSAVVSYEVAFDQDFDWVKGGKLPGLRGGPQATRCSGGNQPNASDQCFSARLMWRPDGAGEIYAYIPTKSGLCNDKDVDCNNDFGTSLGRGDFSFSAGDWKLVTLAIRLNNPVDVANGYMAL